MSGGAFDYKQYNIGNICDDIEIAIRDNESTELDSFGYPKATNFSPNTIQEFKNACRALRVAEVYAQRIDWLLSGDDGEDSFHRRLKEDLNAIRHRF